jgi:hypothetical protein
MSASQNWLADLGDAGRGGEAGMEAAEARDAQDYAGEDELYAANDGLWHADEQHQVFYTSADASGPGASWSVYVERYASPDAAEPIVGTTHRLSSWPSEEAADREVARLAEQGLAMPR